MKRAKLSTAQDLITEAAVKASATSLIDAGSVLMVTRSGILSHSLPIAVNLVPVALNQDIKAISPSPATDCLFLWFAFKCFERDILNECRKGGTTVHSIEFPSLLEFPIPLPPLAEQKRIVAKIEELFSELDAGEESLRQARRQLGVYRQSLLKQAFEGKLTAQWRKQNPHLLESPSQLIKQIETNAKVAAHVSTRKHEIPTWSYRTLDELTEFVTSGSRGWAKYYSQSGSIFIRAQNLNSDYLSLDSIAYVQPPNTTEGKRTRVKYGDLLITITGANTTKSGWVNAHLDEAYVSQHVALCRPVSDELSEFAFLYIISPAGGRRKLEKDAYGAGKPGLNLGNIRSLEIPLCSLPEQQEIVRLLDEQFTVIEQNEREIAAALKRSEALRQSILKKAFTGQLVPQDPADEPATELLARIRKEREEACNAERTTKKKTAKKATSKRDKPHG